MALMALAALLQSCAPQPENASHAAIGKASGQIIADMSPLIYARLDALPVSARSNRAVALVFPQAGAPPPNPTCAADLKASLVRQLRMLAERAHIDLRMTADAADAAVVFVVGDTLEATKTQTPPVSDWMRLARQSTPVSTSEFDQNFGFPGHFSADFLQGLFTDGADRLIFGVSLVHWVATRTGPEGKACTINFIERLAWLYSLALERQFEEKYAQIGRDARVRAGPGAYDVSAGDVQNFILGVYFCAQFVDRTQLAACSSQVVKLIPENDR